MVIVGELWGESGLPARQRFPGKKEKNRQARQERQEEKEHVMK
jgi:hypothetical protein